MGFPPSSTKHSSPPVRWNARLHRYGLAIAIAFAALFIRDLLDPFLGKAEPYTVGLVGAALAVWLLDWKAAAVTSVLTFFGANFLFIEPRVNWSFSSLQDWTSLVTDGVAYVAIIYLGHRAHVAEGNLADANVALRAADKAKDDFLAQLAHELRNSFLVMMNVVGVLRRAPADKETLDTLDRQVRAASRIAGDLLDAERIRRGDIVLHSSPTDLRSLVREAVARALPAIDAAHQSAMMVLSPEPVTAYVDADRCMQMLTNLLDNAIKYAGAGANIEVAATMDGGRAVLSVRDNGVGLQRRSPNSPSSAGFGIGLPLCEKLARMQGGELVVDSAPDRPGFSVTMRFEHG